jgi:hypothetical protein
MSTKYQYRHTLPEYCEAELNAHDFAVVEAAFEIAQKAHAKQSRDKIDSSIKYISHPLMAFEMLWKMHERDPNVLAAMLLHDALEKGSLYHREFTKLERDLDAAMQARGLNEDEGKTHAFAIAQLCKEVTNPKEYPNDGIKENYQIDRVAGMSLDAKRIKIIDQAASLVCNLTMANDANKFASANELQFAEKAHALVVSIFKSVQPDRTDREALKPYAALFGKAMLRVLPLVQSRNHEQREHFRRQFEFEKLFDPAQYVHIIPDDVAAEERLLLSTEDRQHGLTWLEFDKNGNVVRYALWANIKDREGEANRIQQAMTKQIREMRRMAGQYTEDGGDPLRTLLLPGDIISIAAEAGHKIKGVERVFDLFPPLNAMAFAAAAKNAGAASRGDCELVVSEYQRLSNYRHAIEENERRAARNHREAEEKRARLRRYGRGMYD